MSGPSQSASASGHQRLAGASSTATGPMRPMSSLTVSVLSASAWRGRARPTIGDVYRALDQVHGDASDVELPVVVMRPDRRDDVVVMRLETFEELARSWRRL